MLIESIKSMKTLKNKNRIELNSMNIPTVLINAYPSFPESLDLYKIPFLRLRQSKFKYYSIELIYKDRIGIHQVRERNRKFFYEFKDKIKDINNYYKPVLPNQISSLIVQNDENFVYDFSHWMALFFSNRRISSREVICKSFISFISGKLKSIGALDNYKKIFHIPVDVWASKNSGSFGVAKKLLNDPISILLCCAYKYPDLLEPFSDVTFLFTDKNGNQLLKVEAEDFKMKNFFQKLKIQLFRFNSFKEKWSEEIDNGDTIKNTTPTEKELEDEEKKDMIANALKKELSKGLTNNPEEIDLGEDFEDNDDDYDELSDEETNEELENSIAEFIENEETDELLKSINADDESNEYPVSDSDDDSDLLSKFDKEKLKNLKSKVANDIIRTQYVPEKSKKALKKIAELEEIQEKVLPSFEDMKDSILDEEEFPEEVVNTSNHTIKKSKFITFDKKYYEKKFTKDIDNSVKMLSNADIKVFVTKKEVEDSSTSTDLKETYTYYLEDENGRKHTIKFDVPKIIDNQFIYLGGNKKQFQRQLVLKPLVKIAPDTVHLCTMYNKAIISRRNKNLNQKTAAIKKIIQVDKDNKYKVKIGNGFIKNKDKFSTPLDFDNYSTNIHSINVGKKYIYFDLVDLKAELKKLDIPFKNTKTEFTFGYELSTKKPITINPEIESVTDYLESIITDEDRKKIDKLKVGKKFMHSQMRIMSTNIPILVFLLYCEGFDSIIKKAKINYEFLSKEDKDTKAKIKNVSSSKQGIITLKDGYIVWDKYPIENSMLMNGCVELPLEDLEFSQLNDKDAMAELVSIIFGVKSAWAVMDQFKNFMIDPVSKEVLADFGYPTDLTSILLLANKMLCTNNYINENDLTNYRMRNIEMIDQFVYKTVTDSYIKFRKTQANKKPLSITVKRDAILKEITSQRTLEGVSVLNPILDVEKGRAITAKGPSGLNEDRSYTFAKRSYDKSMLGSIAITTSPDANTGIVRQMTLEPKVTSTRGYIDVTDFKDIDKLNAANLFSPAELLSPPGVINDDTTRTSMSYKQTKQTIPVDGASPVIIGNGVEKLLPQITSNDFSFCAKQDGKIIEKTPTYVILEYKDGSHDSIDISKKILHNGADGFWLESQMTCEHPVGYKFKAKEVLAVDPRWYTRHNDDKGASLNIGVLTKIAILPNDDQYEDSSPITTALAEKMKSDIVMEKHVFLGKNTYVEQMVDVGDKVKTGDYLISFDESFEDPLANKLLDEFRKKGVDDEFDQMSMKHVKSKYTGEIVDIKIQSTLPPDQLSETLGAIVDAYFKKIAKDNSVLKKYSNDGDLEYYKCGQIISKTDKPVETKYGKLEGTEVGEGGVLIKFYIKYKNIPKKGDKLTNYTALKGIISNIIPEGYEAFTLRRPDEQIGTCIAPGAILARKTPSVLLAMFGNKCMIELTEQIRDFYLNN